MTSASWTVKDILEWTRSRFAQLDVATPLLDAQLLLGSVLSLKKVQIYMHLDRVLSEEERAGMRDLVRRRVLGEPVAYLLGHKEWHEIDLFVDKRVLIPRPETETLLDFVLDTFRSSQSQPARILDLCTGSGCLALSLARRFPSANVYAVDISEDALDVARINAKRNNVKNISFIQGDVTDAGLYASLLNQAKGPFDVVVSNPPYVSEEEWKQCDIGVRDFEPKLALTASDEGLSIARQIKLHFIEGGLLSSNSVFGMEVGLAHCDRLAAEESTNALSVFPYNTQSRRFPRGIGFALQDLTGRERFWCCITGLEFDGEKREPVLRPGEAMVSHSLAPSPSTDTGKAARALEEAEARALAEHALEDEGTPEPSPSSVPEVFDEI
jgi:release factor glutamine methyltransferase